MALAIPAKRMDDALKNGTPASRASRAISRASSSVDASGLSMNMACARDHQASLLEVFASVIALEQNRVHFPAQRGDVRLQGRSSTSHAAHRRTYPRETSSNDIRLPPL